jgi:hypothetical protein
MRVRDLQEFLATFTAKDKSVTKQGNAISDAVIFVDINGYLEEIRKMEVYENNQTIFGATKNHHSHRLVMKTKRDQKIIMPDKLHDSIVKKCPELLQTNRSGVPSKLEFSSRISENCLKFLLICW